MESKIIIKYITSEIVADIERERQRQEDLRGAGKFSHTCATPGITDATCIRVLQEEIDEVLDEADLLRRAMSHVTRRGNDELENDVNFLVTPHLREELVQVMAVACAWVERIDAATIEPRMVTP